MSTLGNYSPTRRAADSGRVLTGHLGLVMNRLVRVGRQGAKGGAQSLQAVGPPHDRGHGTAVQSFGQRVPGHVGLQTPFVPSGFRSDR